MKRAKQTLGLFLFYLLSLSVSNAFAGHITSYPTWGHTGDSVNVTGTYFLPNSVIYVWFDQNMDSQMYGDGCGRFGYTPCEPYVTVTTSAYGDFTTSLIIPPGKKVDFLGAGYYQIGATTSPAGYVADATAIFAVAPGFTVTRATDYRGSVVWLSGSNFVPFQQLDRARTRGIVWLDYNGDHTYNQGEPKTDVYVMPDGTLSACPTGLCAIAVVEGVAFFGSFAVRADIYDYPADLFRSTVQKNEAEYYVPSSVLR